MSLKRSGLGAQAVLWGVAGIALLAGLGVEIAALIIDGNWQQRSVMNSAFGWVLFVPWVVILALAFLVLAFVNLPRRRRVLLRSGDPLLTPPAAQQPDPALALRDGETLSFGWHQPTNGVPAAIITILVLGGFYVAAGEALLASVIPSFGNLPLNPFTSIEFFENPLPPMTPLDWSAAAFPIVSGIMLTVLFVILGLHNRSMRITADDRGITQQRSFRRDRFIPWNDMRVFIRHSQMQSGIAGDYYVWGGAHGIIFKVQAKPPIPLAVPDSSRPRSRQPATGSLFDGGYETYIHDAARLLATIPARGYVPLHETRVFQRANQRMRKNFPLIGLTVEEIQNAPLAPAPWQPTMPSTPVLEVIKLNTRIVTPGFWLELLVWMIALGGLFGYFAHFNTFDWNQFWQAGPIVGIVVLALQLFVLGAVAVIPTVFHRAISYQSEITADFNGLQKGGSSSTTGTIFRHIAWEDIRAWGVLPPPPGSKKAPVYVLMTEEGRKFAWSEPAVAQLSGRGVTGDRREAYRRKAEELRELIAGRTGLPLHDLTTVTGKANTPLSLP